MAKKLVPITEEELIAAVNEEGLGTGHPYESELDMGTATKEEKRIQVPGTVGTTKTGNEMYWMCYVVDDNHTMTKCSTHDSKEEAYAMALRRFREFAKAEDKGRTEENSFHFGPVSAWRDPENDRWKEYRAEYEKELKNMPGQSRKKFEDYFDEDNEDCVFSEYYVKSEYQSGSYKNYLAASVRPENAPIPRYEEIDERDMVDTYEYVVKRALETVSEAKGIQVSDVRVVLHPWDSRHQPFVNDENGYNDFVIIEFKSDKRPAEYTDFLDSMEEYVRTNQEGISGQSFETAVAGIEVDGEGLTQ